jgi:hypothetical protein
MTKQARLGPIDPQVNGPLNPAIAGNPQGRAPVGVEEINHVDAAHAAGPFWGAKRR